MTQNNINSGNKKAQVPKVLALSSNAEEQQLLQTRVAEIDREFTKVEKHLQRMVAAARAKFKR